MLLEWDRVGNDEGGGGGLCFSAGLFFLNLTRARFKPNLAMP